MIKAFSAFILLFLIPAGLIFAQGSPEGIKIYSGYLNQKGKAYQHGPDADRKSCSIEFDSPVAFSHQSVSDIPGQLSYFIRFKNGPGFSKFIIKIFTDSEEEYTVDPDSEGKQVGINDEHHIFDAYLIYLILGTDIDHLEVINSIGNKPERYVLDKVEVHDNP